MQRKLRLWREAAYWLALGLLLALSVLLLFQKLGVFSVQWADESRHGVNAYEMMQRGDWVVSTYRGETDYWNLKPPLSMYGIMLGYKLFGYNTVGLRFYSAASMLCTMGLLALWLRRRVGRVASLVSQLFLMACFIVYGPHFARFGDADALYVLVYTLAMLCMLDSARDVRYLYGSAFCFGLAFMAKSWHAAMIPVTCLAFVCVTGQIRKLRPRQYALLIFFGLLPIAPWAVARIRFDGLAFFKAMLGTDVFERATTVLEGHVGGWFYYGEYLLKEPACVLALIVCAGALVWRVALRQKPTSLAWGLALWIWVPIVLFSLCVSKLSWYIFSSLPALGAALGVICGKLATGRRRVFRLACLLACVGLLGYWTAGNLRYVSALKPSDQYAQLMESFFLRERDSGMHAYIQYESENPYAEVDYRQWVQGELLEAVLAGDVICLDGGTAAFVNDPEPAYLIAHETGRETELLRDMQTVFEWGPLTVYRNNR